MPLCEDYIVYSRLQYYRENSSLQDYREIPAASGKTTGKILATILRKSMIK